MPLPSHSDALLTAHLPTYGFDQYLHYPAVAAVPPRWHAYLRERLAHFAADANTRVFVGDNALLTLRISPWDRQHFGFGMAQIWVGLAPEVAGVRETVRGLVDEAIGVARGSDVRFVSTRVHIDNLGALRGLEDSGFRRIDNASWSVVATEPAMHPIDPRVRLMCAADLPRVVEVAEQHSYAGSHFHVDPGFDTATVNRMYGGWVRTAWSRQAPIAVIETAGQVQGFFQYSVDETNSVLGYRYAHLGLLALDTGARGQGIGDALFASTLAMCKQAGAAYIDSAYSSENHRSARIHARHGFSAVYEEATLHAWI